MWLDNDGRAFGEGPYRLLKGVEETGSLWRAAAAMGMAYSKARRIISCCERNLGFTLITRKAGGVSGGGSKLTPEAIEIMGKYETIRAQLEAALGATYARHFGEPAEVQFHEVAVRKRGGRRTE